MPNIQPNEYTLKGGNITVNYLTSNFLGQPFLSYNDGSQTKEVFWHRRQGRGDRDWNPCHGYDLYDH